MIKLTVITSETATLKVDGPEAAELTAESSILIDRSTIYEGAYEWTPSAEAQYIPIADQKATENIKINPIPSNYGLITWDGSILTVS